ncbi:GIY-YIG nuclease family protein [Nocardioides bizhenqiangii]|uniref:GIY-YIG nuclease family protein n=1 Tax=Nocardioides bizhenqiangii TaxID=3095076 RepID=A0ABZ0ZSN4_9ACTN|nr:MULTISPECIES: GIY-YIG nuclease family protein [unclassified Nocardioides]MDZ5621982.1 GIY-YIG nuclease family protein [Nocardioides sp. HM23]WQQ27340.1 GIY-YIG nuclease family protein [Nocardioides sp. HM61]
MTAYVYILRCADGSYYVGSTRDLEKRLWEHQIGLGASYTQRRRPVELVWSAEYPNVGEAFFWEKRIQGWSRAKRVALINGEYDRLPGLAKKDFGGAGDRSLRRGEPLATDPLATVKAMTRPAEVVAVTDEFLAQIETDRPGLVHGLYLHGSLCWGEFYADSDIDFVGVLSRPASVGDLAALEAAHARVREAVPERRYEGFYCQEGDLACPASDVGLVPVHYQGSFDLAGRLDANPVTWHELAERGIIVRGGKPRIHTDMDELLDFTRDNLTSYWEPLLSRMGEEGDQTVGRDDDAVVWVTLGVARLHHLLARAALTSKSGAGRYILDALEPRWHRLADEALALRERPGTSSSYSDVATRGRDAREFLAWAIADGRRLR